MSKTTKIKKQPLVFQRLTGITPAIFDELLSKIAPVNEAENLKRLSRPGRKRKVGGGMQFTLPLEDRLLMLLMYYRTYTTHIFLGLIFGIDGSNVGRNMSNCSLTINTIGFIKPISNNDMLKKPFLY